VFVGDVGLGVWGVVLVVCVCVGVGGVVLCRRVCVCDLLIFLHTAKRGWGGGRVNSEGRGRQGVGGKKLTRVAAPSPRASLGRRTVCGRTEQLAAAGFEALRN